MKPEEQRIAIAEYCGWTITGIHEGDPLYPHCMFISNHSNCWAGDPTKSLDAMHEAEASLSETDYEAYWNELVILCVRQGWERMNSTTAAQRAEAFLRTIGKWTE